MTTKVSLKDVDLNAFVKAVYELSAPRGLGFLHYEEGGLTTEEAQWILDAGEGKPKHIIAHMDYIKGRACKMLIRVGEDEMPFIELPWYDHTDDQTEELLKRFNLPMPAKEEHGISCACTKCTATRNSNKRGHVRGKKIPDECKLDPLILIALTMEKEFPCDRCNVQRETCGGYPRSDGQHR